MVWRESAKTVSENVLVQLLLLFVLILPLVATLGQYVNSGFYRETIGVQILFWPGAGWPAREPLLSSAAASNSALSSLATI